MQNIKNKTHKKIQENHRQKEPNSNGIKAYSKYIRIQKTTKIDKNEHKYLRKITKSRIFS